MKITNGNYRVYHGGTHLKAFRDLITEVCELILEYREAEPVIPALCLPSCGKEISFVPLLIQAAANLRMGKREGFWTASEITTVRTDAVQKDSKKDSKGSIDLGLFNKRHIALVECKAVRIKAKRLTTCNIDKRLEQASAQLLKIDIKRLLLRSANEALRNFRVHNKLIAFVVANVILDAKSYRAKLPMSEKKENELFEKRVKDIRDKYNSHMIAWVKYPRHFVNEKNDQYHSSDDDRKQVSIGQIFILKEIDGSWNY